MKYLFSKSGALELELFLLPNTVIALDYDGTLVPLATKITGGKMDGRVRKLLQKLCAKRPVVLLSGRGQRDLRHRVSGIPFAVLAGNHGLNYYLTKKQGRRAELRVRRVKGLLQKHLRSVKGLEFEDKKLSLSIHYRQSPTPLAARRAILKAGKTLSECHFMGGKFVVNVLPTARVNKGVALGRIVRDLGFRRSIYVGDDVTDEDVFRHPGKRSRLDIRVEKSARSAASFYLEDQPEIVRFLSACLGE